MNGMSFARKRQLALMAMLVTATLCTCTVVLAETPLTAVDSGPSVSAITKAEDDSVVDDPSFHRGKRRQLEKTADEIESGEDDKKKKKHNKENENEKNDNKNDNKNKKNGKEVNNDDPSDTEKEIGTNDVQPEGGGPSEKGNDDQNKVEGIKITQPPTQDGGGEKDENSSSGQNAQIGNPKSPEVQDPENNGGNDKKNDSDKNTASKSGKNENGPSGNSHDIKANTASPVESPAQDTVKQPQKLNDDNKRNGVVLFFLLLLSIGLCAVCIKRKEQIVSLVQGLGGGGPDGGKTSKYEQVASGETNDEEWGWGDDDDNGTNDDDDNDDWGDDDWDDDTNGTTSKNDIEMTTPHFSSKLSYNDANIVQRRPSSGDEEEVVYPTAPGTPSKSLSLNLKSSNGGRSNGMNNNLGGSNGFGSSQQSRLKPLAATTTVTATKIPAAIGGMTMGITSLGPKKKPTRAAKAKKKNLLGASDDDLFASMGFGGPPSATKPKALPSKFASPPAASSTQWAAQTKPSGSSTAFAAKPKASSNNLGMASAPVVAPFSRTPTPVPAPALIPDGFGDDDLNLGDDDLGLSDADDSAGIGGDDNWGDDDGDLDDLLFD